MQKILLFTALLLFLFSCDNAKNAEQENQHAGHDIYYTCSMHPQVVSDKPGKCPICHMDLVPAEKKKNADPNALQLNEQQIQLANIQTDTIQNGSIGNRIVLTGILNFDQTKLESVSSRVPGRIEKLYFKNTGDFVSKGALLFEIYSEELNNAKQEYLLALDRKNTFTGEAVIDFDQLLESSKNKLMLWGMRESQIQAMVKSRKASPLTTFYSPASGYITTLDIREGDYVMEGVTVVTLANLSTLWAEAQAYSAQMPNLSPGTVASVQIPDLGGKIIKGNIAFVNPEISADTRINLLRVAIPNPGNTLKPGMPVYVFLENTQTNALSLPIDAVIRDGENATVWVQTADKTYKSRMVKTGVEAGNRIEIISGLNEGDIVVVNGAYLLNSEFIFKTGADPMAGHDMSNM